MLFSDCNIRPMLPGYRVYRVRRVPGTISGLLFQLVSHQAGDYQDHRAGEELTGVRA